MRALAAGLPPGDGVAVFNRVYLAVTDEVTRRLADGGFSDGPEAAALAVVFAGRYLAAVEDAGGREPGADGTAGAPGCWRPLLEARADPGVHPLQFALAGITAHVGHDLALAVVDTCRSTGRAPAEVAADYAEVGGVLRAIEVRVREELMPGPDLLERLDPLTHAVGSWSLARARDGAWAAARLLWAVRDRPEAYEECAAGLDAAVGLMARALLDPPGPLGPRPAQSSGSSTGAISS
ncbi:hypothetical protein SAMN05216223_109179 [Actinacidiphila yanglinensis]|uniref:Uncharacterized protein n=2 Tax=Actinacidiphila yanglinensis TaxID=310779 RepID=A0A1H6CM26_9ACTN|nr:hypothetical protein SAMN05216223_109179 [Actinacidiphila yanglinensis]